MSVPHRSRVDTVFASARRETPATLARQRAALLADATAVAMLEAMPTPAIVVDRQRQIVAWNALLVERLGLAAPESLLGQRPGEAVGCVHARERVAGCGTTASCAVCGAVSAMLRSLATHAHVVRESRIDLGVAGALDLRVHASAVEIGGETFVVLGLEDIAAEKRRDVLERTLLGGLLDDSREAHGAAQALAAEGEAPAGAAVRHATRRVLDRVEALRQLVAAERGELALQSTPVELPVLLDDVAAGCREAGLAENRTIRIECGRHATLETDPVVLAHALARLLENALEATCPGGTVSIGAEFDAEHVTLSIHNEGVIPAGVQAQVFQRSFTTSGERGRGLGTYAARLFVERCLGGRITFASDERVGTLFLVMLPRQATVPVR